jgi:nitrogen fixation protein FixH
MRNEGATVPGANWKMDLSTPDGRMLVKLTDKDGSLQHGLTVSAYVGRPSDIAEDRTIAFDAVPGGYGAGDALPRGQWLVEVKAMRAGNLVFREQRRIIVEGQ